MKAPVHSKTECPHCHDRVFWAEQATDGDVDVSRMYRNRGKDGKPGGMHFCRQMRHSLQEERQRVSR